MERLVSIADVYRFGYLLGFRNLRAGRFRTSLRLFVEPCNYWRNVEVPLVINLLQVRAGDRVLDIGSPKIASLYIWYRLGAEVYATDLYPYFFDEFSQHSIALGARRHAQNYVIELQDARKLQYPNNHFDRVYAISVVEHIDEDGDSQAMREIHRVLKPGGICCLTVPYANRYRESLITHSDLYYKKASDDKPVFYQRHYDGETLTSRLIMPSGLKVLCRGFIEERWVSFEDFYESLPRSLRMAMTPLGPLCSKMFLKVIPAPASSRAKAAFLVLSKDN